MNEKNYRFNFSITSDDGEIINEGSTYISTIDDYGGCESVEMEVSKYLRVLKKKIDNE